jgi:hypothetical protein
VVAIAMLCIVGYGTLQIAARSGGAQHDGDAPADHPKRYVDPEYGFSLMVDPRFADDTAPGGVNPGFDYYTKVWLASDSAIEGKQPLDTIGVAVLDRPAPVGQRMIDAELRTILKRPSAYLSGWGANARLDEVAESEVDGLPAVVVTGRCVGLAGVRVRERQVIVPLRDRLVVLGSISSPANWNRNLRAFDSMVASFRLPPDER